MTQPQTQAERLAAFAVRASYDMLSDAARRQIKIRLLDSLGCAIGALDGEPVLAVRAQVDAFGGAEYCTLIGDGRTAPDRAALYNTALVRYLDFMDAFLAKGETCHPSDNLGAVLAAAEYANASGKDFLAALALAYHVECRLTETAPIMEKGFDHTTQLAFSIAAGVSRALGLDERATANALALCGTESLALSIIRASPSTQWKGLASSGVALAATHATFLAMRGVTGPLAVFEGFHGFMDAVRERFTVDWPSEGLDGVTRTVVKKYNAEVHSQSAIEGILELREAHHFAAEDVERIEVEIFLTAYNIIGGGEYGERTTVETKEQADHSLPYIMAVAVLDGDVTPQQYLPERIRRADVQALLHKVAVRPKTHVAKPQKVIEQIDPYTRRYPDEMPCRIAVTLRDGRTYEIEKRDYEGFNTRPLSWDRAVEKFERLSAAHADSALRRNIVAAVADLETIPVADLAQLLSRVAAHTV